jgi:hypothetical protein
MEKFYSSELTKEEVESIAISKYYKRGKCKNSCFASGGHRIGLVPMSRPDDGGLQGVSCQEVCIECRKKFSYRCFLPDVKGTLK